MNRRMRRTLSFRKSPIVLRVNPSTNNYIRALSRVPEDLLMGVPMYVFLASEIIRYQWRTFLFESLSKPDLSPMELINRFVNERSLLTLLRVSDDSSDRNTALSIMLPWDEAEQIRKHLKNPYPDVPGYERFPTVSDTLSELFEATITEAWELSDGSFVKLNTRVLRLCGLMPDNS